MSMKIKNCESEVVGDILETLRFRGSIFFRSELASPWGIALEKTTEPRFHIIMNSECYIGTDDAEPLKMKEMDIVMVPNGSSHWIADKPNRTLISSTQASEACELGHAHFQHGQLTHHLICGLVNYDENLPHPFLQSLPDLLHFSKSSNTDPIRLTVMLLDAEIRNSDRLKSPIIDRLAEVLFLQLLYDFISEQEHPIGFLAALRNPQLRLALELIHQKPNESWTLSLLGKKVGMSSATLVRHFQTTVGVSPMAYVANWRMTKAHSLVKYSNLRIEEIAEATGYLSTQTLNKAFKRHFNYTPNELRKKVEKYSLF